jgi:hypothetical protein
MAKKVKGYVSQWEQEIAAEILRADWLCMNIPVDFVGLPSLLHLQFKVWQFLD